MARLQISGAAFVWISCFEAALHQRFSAVANNYQREQGAKNFHQQLL
jgi:hypothetical protein